MSYPCRAFFAAGRLMSVIPEYGHIALGPVGYDWLQKEIRCEAHRGDRTQTLETKHRGDFVSVKSLFLGE